MLFWLLGDLSPAGDPSVALIVLAGCAALAFSQSAALDVLILGEDKARSLGVAVTRLQAIAFGCATLATVAAVLLGGSIGFVGLVVPHLLRLSGIHRHGALLPLSACLGGSLLALADTLARTGAASSRGASPCCCRTRKPISGAACSITSCSAAIRARGAPGAGTRKAPGSRAAGSPSSTWPIARLKATAPFPAGSASGPASRRSSSRTRTSCCSTSLCSISTCATRFR